MRITATTLVSLGLAGGTAAASPFVNIHRQDGVSRAGVELTYHVLDDNANDSTLLRFEAHGQYISAATGFGGYAQVPIGYLSDDNDSITGLGNVELGGIFLPRTGSLQKQLIVYAGLTLPTSSTDDTPTVLLAQSLRPHDVYQGIPKGTIARIGVSPTYSSGRVFARADIAADIVVDAADGIDKSHGLELDAGVGLNATEDLTLTVELSTITIFRDDADGDLDPLNLMSLAFGLRFHAGRASPYLGVLLPVDDDLSHDFDAGLMLGVDAAI